MQTHNKKKPPLLFENKENCCGCSACYAACPLKAISMVSDSEGFVYPQINGEKCIGCLKCTTVCAFKAAQKLNGYL